MAPGDHDRRVPRGHNPEPDRQAHGDPRGFAGGAAAGQLGRPCRPGAHHAGHGGRAGGAGQPRAQLPAAGPHRDRGAHCCLHGPVAEGQEHPLGRGPVCRTAPVLHGGVRDAHRSWHDRLQGSRERRELLPGLLQLRRELRIRRRLPGALLRVQSAADDRLLLGLHLVHVLHGRDAGHRAHHIAAPEEDRGHQLGPVGECRGESLPWPDGGTLAHQALLAKGKPL
mmetsp:Transcript_17919/g.49462  ORF Transcript_17919/g.49462 Transcript_17919/m.49462 type:complete len:225 (-) Transcript_17919:1020-1694(-)